MCERDGSVGFLPVVVPIALNGLYHQVVVAHSCLLLETRTWHLLGTMDTFAMSSVGSSGAHEGVCATR